METLTPQNPCYSTQLVLGTLSGDCTFDLKMQGGGTKRKKWWDGLENCTKIKRKIAYIHKVFFVKLLFFKQKLCEFTVIFVFEFKSVQNTQKKIKNRQNDRFKTFIVEYLRFFNSLKSL